MAIEHSLYGERCMKRTSRFELTSAVLHILAMVFMLCDHL